MSKTAVIIGATGLVGAQLLRLLLADNRFRRVVVLARRSTGQKSTKLEEHLVNFDTPVTWAHLVKGDVLFSAMGATLKAAGGKDAQYRIDHTYQLETAKAAAANAVPAYVLISSAGANPRSGIFYSRMKGELERDIKGLPFRCISIIQPGLLTGRREEQRGGEQAAYYLLKAFNAIGLFRKYRPIEAETVARAMICAAMQDAPGVRIYTLDAVFSLAAGTAQ
jgi:uncharacterized protein YbjT (DUF2867 family)